MSAEDPNLTAFERRVRQMLLESAGSADARVRSRLNQARQKALEAVDKPRRVRAAGWLPAMGAVTAALLVAFIIIAQSPHAPVQVVAADRPTVDDLDLLADGDGLDIVQSDDGFYEWAMLQADGNQAGTGNGV